eukprot:TRINITY_DN99_c0_g1_i14.p1 TRINITY_DN99_c0_g1~~TRINITY_DN99_c0_g1_i14.p1  ORF type:complete len:230 (+),score=27.05 TRINITY_DN99_c0_g1_i14:58-747(+)
MAHASSFCSRVCWASCCGATFFVFLVIAALTPWYATSFQYDYNDDNSATVVQLFYWKGVWKATETKIDGDKKDDSDWVGWDKLDSDKPKSFYMAAAALTIVASLFALLFTILIIVGLWLHSTSHQIGHALHGFTKWIVFAIGAFAFLLNIIGWALFIGFPSALHDSNLCNKSDEHWCGSFSGTDSKGDFDYAWGPNAAWIIAVIAAAPAIISLILVAIIPTRSHHYQTM